MARPEAPAKALAAERKNPPAEGAAVEGAVAAEEVVRHLRPHPP